MNPEELKKLKSIQLSALEKKELFERILRATRPVPSPYSKLVTFSHMRYVKVGILAALILSVSGATAFASLGALPGELLYGVKTHVVEKIPDLVTFRATSKAKQDTAKIETRIAEIEQLKAKGKLTEKNKKILKENIADNLEDFSRHIENVPDNVPDIKVKNDDNAITIENPADQENGRNETGRNNGERSDLESQLRSNLKKHSQEIKALGNDEENRPDEDGNSIENLL